MEKLDTSKAKMDKTLGYYYLICKGHPLACKGGKIYLHRYLKSIEIGRWLLPDENVDHIDEDKTNNDLSNLQVLTRSEHATKTMRHKYKVFEGDVDKCCGFCEKVFRSQNKKSKYCSVYCRVEATRRFTLKEEDLRYWVFREPTTKIAKRFGCSDVLVAKYCKRYGIDKPPRGYWAKRRSKGE